MRKIAILLSVAVMAGGAASAVAQQAGSGFRTGGVRAGRVFNPFSVRASVARGFSLRGFTATRNSPFVVAPVVETAPVVENLVENEAVTPLSQLSSANEGAGEEVFIPAFGSSSRPPYTPPVRSPFRPPPRPPFGP